MRPVSILAMLLGVRVKSSTSIHFQWAVIFLGFRIILSFGDGFVLLLLLGTLLVLAVGGVLVIILVI